MFHQAQNSIVLTVAALIFWQNNNKCGIKTIRVNWTLKKFNSNNESFTLTVLNTDLTCFNNRTISHDIF